MQLLRETQCGRQCSIAARDKAICPTYPPRSLIATPCAGAVVEGHQSAMAPQSDAQRHSLHETTSAPEQMRDRSISGGETLMLVKVKHIAGA